MIATLLALLAVVNVTPNQMTYACNGVTAAFAVSYPYLAYTDLVVTSTTSGGSVTTLTNPANWTINLTSTSTSATLTLTNPAVTCPTGNTLKITRTLQTKQPQSFRGTQVLPDTVERAFDRTEMQIQQVSNLFSNGTLGQGGGGTGTTSTLTCSADQFLTSTAPAYSCSTLNVSRDASLSGSGSIASPLAINLANSNSFTVGQTFAASGSGLAAVTITPTTTQPASPINGNLWLDPTDGMRIRYNGSWHVLSTAPLRRTPLDANDYIAWVADESALPLVNTGSAGSNGNITTVNAASSGSFGCLGTFSNSYCTNGTGKNGSSGASSGTLNPALPVSFSAWTLIWAYGPGGELFGKKFQPNGTYTGALLTLDLGVTNGGAPSCDLSTAGARTSCSGSAGGVVALNSWHHIGCTYDGSNMRLYLDGQLVNTCVKVGAIDYGTNGPWYIGANSDNSGGIFGFIDDVRVSTVLRPLSYFQNIWTTATGNGGN